MPKSLKSPSREDAELAPSGNASLLAHPSPVTGQPPAAGLAFHLVDPARRAGAAGMIVVTTSEARAAETGRALAAFAPDTEVLVLPPWDCLPYDRASPSRASMGKRVAVLHRLTHPADGPRVLVTSAEAALQMLPPRKVVLDCRFTFAVGDVFDAERFRAFADRAGYIFDDRVDEPGEVAMMGHAVDIFPADASVPSRLMLSEDGRIEAISSYDPITQRTEVPLDALVIGSATELIQDESGEGTPASGGGIEHRLADHYQQLETIFTLMPDASLFVSEAAEERLHDVFELIAEAREARRLFAGEIHGLPRRALHLDAPEWEECTSRRDRIASDLETLEPVPKFALSTRPARALGQFVRQQWEAGRRVLVTGQEGELKRLASLLRRAKVDAAPVQTLDDLEHLASEEIGTAPFDLDAGFIETKAAVAIVAAPDLLGARVYDGPALSLDGVLDEPELRVGDVVIHEDHGVGVLRALEQVEVDGETRDVVRLEYKDGASLLAPVEEFGKIWRYGSEEDAVALDRLKGDGWQRRRGEISAEIDAVAGELVRLADERSREKGQPIDPPGSAYRRLAARFPYPETADQGAAIAAVLKDLQSGKPMHRLVCGDVGFGKTEVALRAAAAMALSGRQVAVVAPTTVLVRQHLQSFERRFAGTGIKVAQLSRLLSPAEMRAVKAGMADGSIGIVIATHALAGKNVAFNDLGLLIIDEEQRFGAKMKAELTRLAQGLHVLSMSATPIPRTLQGAMVGLQEVSVIATPPARRRPIRTLLSPFDGATVRTALLRERRRHGQSFFVVPRIEDIDPIAAELGKIAPELSVVIAHGELPAADVDAAMVAFANGEGDVLLATNIIESGLDVPQANTMLVWHPERFGLSQLHQLRGRVGRGRQQGVVYLLTDPEHELPEATMSRLSTLMALDRLGAGLAISARDLDFRGAGDLVGDEQAGHSKLIGTGLYQRLLERAVTIARGEPVPPEVLPEMRLDMRGAIPQSYVGEAVIRINLYARLLRMTTLDEVREFAEELEDRFGERPAEVETLLALSELQLLAQARGIVRIEAGPKAIALTLAEREKISGTIPGTCEWKKDRLVCDVETEAGSERIARIKGLLESLARSGER